MIIEGALLLKKGNMQGKNKRDPTCCLYELPSDKGQLEPNKNESDRIKYKQNLTKYF